MAEQRAELHGKLNAMLYGIEAAPAAAPSDSAVQAVLARVQAYRESKSQIEQARSLIDGVPVTRSVGGGRACVRRHTAPGLDPRRTGYSPSADLDDLKEL